MRTFSHAIVTAAVGKRVGLERGRLVAFVLGSILPDLPLGVLTLLAILNTPDMAAAMVYMDQLYFTSPLWIGLHNAPHSLVLMGLFGFLGAVFRQKRWGRWFLWYVAGAALHVVFDVFTHAGDGPMFLYPLSTFRFDSPVSYWDPAHYGGVFTVLEYSLDALLILYLGIAYLRRERLPA